VPSPTTAIRPLTRPRLAEGDAAPGDRGVLGQGRVGEPGAPGAGLGRQRGHDLGGQQELVDGGARAGEADLVVGQAQVGVAGRALGAGPVGDRWAGRDCRHRDDRDRADG
jgi:hypothetical protein